MCIRDSTYTVSATYPDGTESDPSESVEVTPQAQTVHQESYDDGTAEVEWDPDGSGQLAAVRFSANNVGEQLIRFHWYQVGDGGAFRPEGDGGDFAAGTSLTTTDQVFDGGDFTAGTSEATDDQIIEGTDVSSPYFGTTTGPENYG